MARRTIKIDLRLTESEAAALNRDVEKAGVSREAYLRSLIRKMPLKEKPPVDVIDILKDYPHQNIRLTESGQRFVFITDPDGQPVEFLEVK